MTYSDLMTLLLVFFVLLYMLTPGIDESTFDNFVSFFQKSTGVMSESAVVSESNSSSREDAQETIMEMWEAVQEFLEQQGLSSQVNIEQTDEGVKLTLSGDLTFESGSTEILPSGQITLEEVASVLNESIVDIEVQGHTDDVPISQNSPYRSNWHLGAARAVSVVLFIQERSLLIPEQFQATSFGEYRPLAANETPEGRRQNRRVEIYVRYQELIEPPDPGIGEADVQVPE